MNKLLKFQVFSTLLLGCALCVISIEAAQQTDSLDTAQISTNHIIEELIGADYATEGCTALTDSSNNLLHHAPSLGYSRFIRRPLEYLYDTIFPIEESGQIAREPEMLELEIDPDTPLPMAIDSSILLGCPHAKGHTELYDAAANGQVAEVRKLLKDESTDVNAEDNNGTTALMAAVSNGSLETVQELLKAKGINVNHKSFVDKTALMWASCHGHTAIVKELLDVDGIDIDAQDNLLQTALHEAVKFGHAEVVELLLKAGADKTLKDSTGRIPAECCVFSDLQKTIEDLLALEASE